MLGGVQLACSLLVFQTLANAGTSPTIASECEISAAEIASRSSFEAVHSPSLLQVATKSTESTAKSKEAANTKTRAKAAQIRFAAKVLDAQLFVWVAIVVATVIIVSLLFHALNRQANASHDVAKEDDKSYRPDIDGLRAVAVLAVVLYHLDSTWLPGGFLGVDIFFVISGFVVTQSLFRSGDEGMVAYYKFYARRAKRLMPGHLFMTALVGLLMACTIPPWEEFRSRYFTSGQFALIGMSNNYFASMKASYFDTGPSSLAMNPFTHTWSLGVEEQFYLTYPLLLTMAHGASLPKYSEDGHDFQLRPVLVLGLIAGSSLLAAFLLNASYKETAFYILPSRLWQLAAGALLFQVQSFSSNATDAQPDVSTVVLSAVLQLAACLSMACCLVLSTHDMTFSLPMALLAVTGAVCFISAGRMPHAYLNRCLSNWLIVYIGKISYPLYLFHWPVIIICTWTLGIDTLSIKLVCVAISALLAAFTYHVVESPVRAWRPARPWVVLASMGVGVLLVELWLAALKEPLRSKFWISIEYPAQPREAPAGGNIFLASGARQAGDDCGCRVADRTWHVPASANNGSDASRFTPCFVGVPPESQAARLDAWPLSEHDDLDDLAQNTSLNTIFLLGDSHADRLRPGVLKVIQGRQFKLFYGGNCFYGPWTDQFKTHWESLTPGHTQFCQDVRDRTEQHFAQNLKPGDLVFVSNNIGLFKPQVLNGKAFESWLKSYREDLVALHKMISARGGKMLLFGFNHELKTPGKTCVPTLWDPDAPRKCEVRKTEYKREHQPYVEPVMNMYTELAGTKSGIAVFDIFDLFCDDETCGAFIPGTKTLAISDTNHLTVSGSEYLAPYLCNLLRSNSMLPSS